MDIDIIKERKKVNKVRWKCKETTERKMRRKYKRKEERKACK